MEDDLRRERDDLERLTTAQVLRPAVTLTFHEYLVLTTKAAKCDRLVAAFELEGTTA